MLVKLSSRHCVFVFYYVILKMSLTYHINFQSLESVLRLFACLSKGDVLAIKYNNKVHKCLVHFEENFWKFFSIFTVFEVIGRERVKPNYGKYDIFNHWKPSFCTKSAKCYLEEYELLLRGPLVPGLKYYMTIKEVGH